MRSMSLDEIIKKRRSVREYSSREVDLNDLRKVIEAARFAPSACNKQPWRFVVVTAQEKVRMVFEKSLGGVISNSWAKTAPVFIVACAEKSLMVHKLAAGFKKIPYHFLDMGAAIEQMLLKATELGLGTCWIGWFNKKVIRKLFAIPKSLEIVSLIAIGHRCEDSQPEQKNRKELNQMLFLNRYGNEFDLRE
jgi:nitroreductase